MNALEFITKNIEGLSAIAAAVWAIYKTFLHLEERKAHGEKITKYNIIRELVPYIHDLVEKSAKFTEGEKDDHYVAEMRKALTAYGIELLPEEEDGIKTLGAAQHNVLKGIDSLGKPEEA